MNIQVSKEVPLAGSADVVVVGGGIAGVAAAIAARRNGATVLLVEKTVSLGGLATIGFIDYWEPLCDGKGTKIIGGLGEELLFEALKYGYDFLPGPWRPGGEGDRSKARYCSRFSPFGLILALDEIVAREGADLLFDAQFTDTFKADGSIAGIVVHTKSGPQAYSAKVIIDCTGDAEIFAGLGAACAVGTNWLSYCAYLSGLEDFEKAMAQGDIKHALRLRTWGADRLGRKIPPGSGVFDGTDVRDITRFVTEGRKLVREDIAALDKRKHAILALPSMPQLRTIRRIQGDFLMKDEHVFARFDDSIGSICDFSTPGPIYEIPYRTLYARSLPNVLTAGRSISAEGTAWEVTRVIPPAALTGQAAGTAAAMAAKRNLAVYDVPIGELQERLAAAGVMIHRNP